MYYLKHIKPEALSVLIPSWSNHPGAQQVRKKVAARLLKQLINSTDVWYTMHNNGEKSSTFVPGMFYLWMPINDNYGYIEIPIAFYIYTNGVQQVWIKYFQTESISNNINRTTKLFFTRGQFWPSGIVGACVCPSVRSSVRPSVTKFVHAIAYHPFKLESPILDYMCKIP